MATDYDAPRKTDDDSESIEALKERVPDKTSGSIDNDDADNPGSFELAGGDEPRAAHHARRAASTAATISCGRLVETSQ